GIQRAYGPALHPIYFGVAQLLALGWVSYGAIRALKRRTAPLWVFAPLIAVAGIFCTASRGPILGAPVALVASLFLFWPKLRWPIGLLFVAMAASAIVFHEPIITQLETWSGEGRRDIEIQGEERVQSSVRSRINLIEVNKIALKRSGLLGFGSDAVAGFPINVPVGEMEAKTLKAVKYIDNTYILLTLRFGYLGVASFLLAFVCCLGQLFFIAVRYSGQSPGTLSCCLGGVLFAALLVQATVWLPPDIGFPLLFTMGVSSGLVVAHADGRFSDQNGLSRRPER
ncbi:MAG: O-antigen ligase family protein, partial [Planctomycetota bacterium]